MKEKFRGPKKGDNPFLVKSFDINSPTWASLSWMKSFNADGSFLAEAFKEAGDKIIQELSSSEDWQRPEKFFMPTAYLYRHCLELKMKEIIRLCIRIELIKKDKKVEDALKEHKLYQLWNYVKRGVTKHWPNGSRDDICAVERIIQEFHEIDKSGQSFRYTENKSGRKTLNKLPESVQLSHIKDVVDAVFNFFVGSEDGLVEALRMKNEMECEYFDP